MTPKPAECGIALAAQYQKFLSVFADLDLLESAVRDTANEQVRRSLEVAARLKAEGLEDTSYSHHHMTFRSFIDGKHIFYESRTRHANQIREDFRVHQNKQNQWIVAEAYEAFKELIDCCYAYAQHIGPPLWKASQLAGLPSSPPPASPTIDELLKAAANSKVTGDAYAKLTRFRAVYPQLLQVERSNPLSKNPCFTLALIELLRHIIVHNGGKPKTRAMFENRVLTKSGLLNNGKPDKRYVGEIGFYLTEYQGNCIVLLTDANKPDFPGAYVSRVTLLTNILMAYGHIIYSELLVPNSV